MYGGPLVEATLNKSEERKGSEEKDIAKQKHQQDQTQKQLRKQKKKKKDKPEKGKAVETTASTIELAPDMQISVRWSK